MDILTIKNKIEVETGLKISIKKNPLSSSLRGYVTFSTKKIKGLYTEWAHSYRTQLSKKYNAPEPHPTFVNNYSLIIYIGDNIYE